MGIDDQRITQALDKLTKEFSSDDIALLKEIMHKNHGSELELLMSLMNYTYKYVPVPVKQFVEDEEYLGLRGQVFPILLDDLDALFEGDYNEAILTGAIGWGKCCHPETIIPTDQGFKRLKDICVGDMIFSLDQNENFVKNEVKGKKVSHKNCMKVTFESGLSIEASPDHPVLTDSGWKHIEDLTEHDFIAASLTKFDSELKFDENLVKFLAYLTAEGSTIETVRFTNGNKDILDEFTASAYGVGAKAVNLISETPNFKTISATGVLGITRAHGLYGKKSTEKRIPEYVWKSGSKGIALFLNRFFACDGSIYQKPPYKIECTLASEGMIDDILLACRMLGIYGRKVSLKKHYNKDKKFPAWRFAVTDSENIKKFISVVGQIYTKEWTADLPKTNANKNITPINYDRMKDLRQMVGGIPRDTWDKIRIPKGQYAGRAYADKIISLLGDSLNKQWGLWLNPNICWEKVVSITDIGKMDLYDIDVPETRNFIGDGIIVHNSTFAEIAICRMIYEVSCFKNPQKALGLMDGSVIAFINVSLSKEAAKKVVFHGLKSKLLGSKYFREYFPITAGLAEELRLINNVWVFPVASGEHSILGYNVLGGVMDEVNFMDIVENSRRAGGTNQIYDQADKLQKQLIRRMKSRYMTKGKLPGILLQISSSAYPDDYTERRILEAEDDPTIFVRRYSQWDTLPKDKYNPQKFQLSLGDILERPRIITCKEDLAHAEEKGFKIIEVPEDYKKDFEKNIDESIRDLAGLPTLTIHPFVLYREKILEAMDRGQVELGLEHPFTKEVSTLRDGGVFIPEKLLIPKWKVKYETEEDPELKENYKIIYNNLKQKPRFVHIDLARTTMAGISVGFVNDYKEVIRRNEEGQDFTTRMPVIVIEFMLRVMAPQYGEIEASYVRSLVHELRSYGYRIGKVTFDQYQSLESQHQFIEKGIDSGQVSADGNPAVYNALKDAIYEDRLMTYWYEPAYWEIIRLEKNERTGKVDHPKSGSKDVSDSMAGVCFLCVENAPHAPTPPPMLGKLDKSRSTLAEYRRVPNKEEENFDWVLN